MEKINYLKIQKELLQGLSPRIKDVIERRFGLKRKEKETLESIGKDYKICRERVRQIESKGLEEIRGKIKKKEYQKIFDGFVKHLKKVGGLERKDLLLSHLGGDFQNQLFFLLNFCSKISFSKETKEFYPFFFLSDRDANKARGLIKNLVNYFEKEKKTIGEKELFNIFQKKLKKKEFKNISEEIFFNYLAISKRITKGPHRLFGLSDWPEILPKGVKDKAYLVFKVKKTPLHFREVADLINNLKLDKPISERQVIPATVHNELIRDPRFVLVGRGKYALREWGYEPGFVKDIISKVLRDSKKPLPKEEIVKKVLAQRFVKENTVVLNLQNKKYFLRDPKGHYTIREV